jgi:hypothetical protein
MTVRIDDTQDNAQNTSQPIPSIKNDGPQNFGRRKAMRKLAVGAVTLAGCSMLPEKWTSPLVEFGSLPAHAATSGPVSSSTTKTSSATTSSTQKGSGNFNLLFVQTKQSCASCGIWFDSAELVITHSQGTFTRFQSGSLLIKQSPSRQGRFQADISSIPASATIKSATLYMNLNRKEGIANSDNSSVIAVYDYSSGRRGALVRYITARGDIKGRGYSKAKPRVPINFTSYAQQIHGGK